MTGPSGEIAIERVREVTHDVVAAVARLVPQLSSSAQPPDESALRELVDNSTSALYLALGAGGSVVGMLTLVTYRLPTGIRAVIEDVVVDEGARGAGVASALVSTALEEASRRGARYVDLTSRPQREAANNLYERMGFERRQTNVYRRNAT